MKKLICIFLCMVMMTSLSACTKEEEEFYETTLSFDKKGKITDVIVESFTESYYSEDGLRAYFQEKISEYNSRSNDDGNVSLENLEVSDGKAKATLVFDNCDTYTSFYGTGTFYGTVSDAYDKGYVTETVLKKVGSSDTISKLDLMKMSDAEIIIVSEVVRVHSPKKIQYVSANVEVIGENDVRVSSDSSGLAYILVK